jgi:anti-sigma factor RsiW
MREQHLSDEAVAAFADGVLRGHARERATRHTETCRECRAAVKVQREAAWALRTAPAPSLPVDLFERLQSVPQTTVIAAAPTVIGPDGSAMLSTMAPMAAFVAPKRHSRKGER